MLYYFESNLIWVCTVCICHFVRNFGVQTFRTFTVCPLFTFQPSNIFFSVDGVIKMGDFGLATALPQEQNEVIYGSDNCLFKKHTAQVGTQLYMSPEQVSNVFTLVIRTDRTKQCRPGSDAAACSV